jgi:hypothetical protein
VQSFSGRGSGGLMTTLSQIRDSPNLEGQVPQERGSPVISSGTGFPFRRLLRLARLRWRYSNLPLRGSATSFKVKVTLRLVFCRQSVRLGAKPLEVHDQSFLTEPLRSSSLCNILSDESMGLCFMNILGLL